MWVAALVLAAGCRDYTDDRGARLAATDVLAGRPPAAGGPAITDADLTAGHFVSDDTALVPLRDRLRTLAWDIHGDILGSFTLALPAGVVTSRSDGTTRSAMRDGIAFSIDVDPLLSEIAATVATPIETMFAHPDISLGTPRTYLDHLTFRLRRTAITAVWSATRATLELHLPFDVDVDPQDWLPVEVPDGTLDLVVDVGFTPSAATASPRFLNYFGFGRDLRDDFAGVTLGLHAGNITGFGDYRAQLSPTVIDVVSGMGEFLTTLRTPPDTFGSGSAWRAWCDARIGGCPFSPQALARLAGNGAQVFAGSSWRLADGTTVTASTRNDRDTLFDDHLLDLIALGGTQTRARVTPFIGDTAEAACRACGTPSEQAGDCAICEACDSPADPDVGRVCAGTVSAPFAVSGADAATIPASPRLAQLEEGVFSLADQLRGLAAQPLVELRRPELVYTDIVRCPDDPECPTGANGVVFELATDPDHDGVPVTLDNCPAIANADQTNSDFDTAGDACDPCPTVFGTSPADADGDGTPDLCDCDADNDSCSNSVPAVDGEVCTREAGEAWDQNPRTANPQDLHDHDGDRLLFELLDWDNDGVIDDCDPDDDADGVLDDNDNCHWESNPTQTDTNHNGIGDACDLLCRGPSDGHCAVANVAGLEPIGFLRWFGMLPAWPQLPWCIVDGPGCWILTGFEPAKSGVDLVLRNGAGEVVSTIDLAAFGLPAGGPAVSVGDLDGDGRGDLVIGDPAADQVLAISSVTSKLLWTWSSPLPGQAGAALAFDGSSLWVGAPEAAREKQVTGAVIRIALSPQPELGAIAWGSAAGERYGASLATATIGGATRVLVAAPGASTAKGQGSGRFELIDEAGAAVASFPGPAAGTGAAARASLVVEQGALVGVALGAPTWNNGAGELVMLDPGGAVKWVQQGAPKSALGAAVVATETAKGTFVVAGQPGYAGDAGAVVAFDLAGKPIASTTGGTGAQLGAALATLPDLDHDGVQELVVGTTLGDIVLATH
jgi:hypothetical protein